MMLTLHMIRFVKKQKRSLVAKVMCERKIRRLEGKSNKVAVIIAYSGRHAFWIWGIYGATILFRIWDYDE